MPTDIEKLMQSLNSMPSKEIIDTLGRVALPWEVEDGLNVRYNVVGGHICRGQKTQRDMDIADDSLREQGFVLLDSQEFCPACQGRGGNLIPIGHRTYPSRCSECNKMTSTD